MAIGSVYGCLFAAARERGVDVGAVLRRMAVAEGELAAAQVRLPPDADDWLVRQLVGRAREPGLGVSAAARIVARDLELLGYLIKSADTLGDAFALMQRYARLVGDSMACTLRQEDDRVALMLGRTGGRVFSDEMTDFVVGVTLRVVREIAPHGVHLLEVRLRRARPRDPRPLRAFFGAPIRFGMPVGELVFAADALSAPVASADPVLARILRPQADGQLSQLTPDAAIPERVRAALSRQLSRGAWDLPSVAGALNMSPRTLRRRLHDEGTSLRALLDDVRRERALVLAEAGCHNATEIAVALGFADTTSLARAFRRWTGASPRAFLKQAQEQRGPLSALPFSRKVSL